MYIRQQRFYLVDVVEDVGAFVHLQFFLPWEQDDGQVFGLVDVVQHLSRSCHFFTPFDMRQLIATKLVAMMAKSLLNRRLPWSMAITANPPQSPNDLWQTSLSPT